MIPILYAHDETTFSSNGIARLAECVSCTVTEERNGIYECQFVYPTSGVSYSKIEEGCFVGVWHDESHDLQPFEIYARSTPLNGLVTFYGHHLSYRLGNIIVKPFTASSCAAALDKLRTEAINAQPFDFWTDKQTAGSMTVSTPTPARELIGGTQGSILDCFGTGEYEFDKWTVKLHLNRGEDTGIAIRYGKNLTDMKQDFDLSSTYNAVVPFWAGDGQLVTVPGYIVSLAETLDQEERLTTMDLSQDFQEAPTAEQLRTRAISLMTQNESYAPTDNLEVNFVALWQTPEYARFAPLQRVRLCDKVDIIAPELGVVKTAKKVVKTVYDVLLERYNSIELGAPKTSFADVLTADTERRVLQVVPSKSYVDAAAASATDKLAGALGGYVVINRNAAGQPTEILIMDTDDIETAVNVLRINVNGIGFSSTGYAGTYDTAWTLDGAFVADFITTGTLNANLLRAGLITDITGNNFWNLESGEMYLSVAAEAQATADDANETAQNVRNWMTFTADGLSMGKEGSTYSTLVDDVGFHVLQLGEKITTIAKRRVAAEEYRVGKLTAQTRCVLREAGDGGLIITPEAF